MALCIKKFVATLSISTLGQILLALSVLSLIVGVIVVWRGIRG